MRTVGPLRFERLRSLFEGRKVQLHAVPYPELYPGQYSSAVIKYCRARKAWRNARGWE